VSQLHKFFVAGPVASRTRPNRFIVASLLAVMLAGAVILGQLIGNAVPAPISDSGPGSIRGQVSDGWMARYLPSAQRSQVTDGWFARYLPSANRSQVTDGWMARYLPSAQGD